MSNDIYMLIIYNPTPSLVHIFWVNLESICTCGSSYHTWQTISSITQYSKIHHIDMYSNKVFKAYLRGIDDSMEVGEGVYQQI